MENWFCRDGADTSALLLIWFLEFESISSRNGSACVVLRLGRLIPEAKSGGA